MTSRFRSINQPNCGKKATSSLELGLDPKLRWLYLTVFGNLETSKELGYYVLE
jgi:hypothetical protein